VGETASSSLIGLLLATDGVLLYAAASETDAQGRVTGAVLYRLRAGSRSWQTLGPVPEPVVIYVAGPGAGTLWSLPDGWSAFDTSGHLFTASYP
jgi:hypothetical protein